MEGLTYQDLTRVLEKLQPGEVLRSVTVSPDVEVALVRIALENPRGSNRWGTPILVSAAMDPGSWAENYDEKQIVHFADGRVLTIMNPRI